MTKNECPQSDKLREYALGRLELDECDDVASHVQTCHSCEETVASLDGETDPLLRLLRQSPQSEKFSSEESFAEAMRLGKSLAFSTSASRVGQHHPQQLREYRLHEMLGEGGMGAVYRAVHTKLDKTVALKILPADRMRHEGAVARFEREMKAVGRLDHPNIVRASDAGHVDDTHFLVMEYVDGIDLSELVKCVGPIPVTAACEIIRQAAIGLEHAHNSEMVHRDIKPHNIMVTADGTVKILDLGLALLDEPLAQQHEAITSTGQVMGTLDYMAPEQIEDSHHVDRRADIYSLGATLYKLLTGSAPFADSKHTSPLKLMLALVNDPPPSIRERRQDLPDELVEVLQRMMSKQPDDRFASAKEVAESLERFCSRQALIDLMQSNVHSHSTAHESSSVTLSDGADVAPREIQPAARSQSVWRKPAYRFGAIAAGLFGVVALAMVVVLRMQTPYGEVVVSFADGVDREQVRIEVKGNDQLKIADAKNDWTIDVGEGTYQVRILGGDDRFQLDKDKVEVIRKGQALLTVQLLPNKSDEKKNPIGQVDPIVSGPSPLDQLRRADISEYELTVAGDDDPLAAISELVAVIGDSRMRHRRGPIFSVDISANGEAAASLGEDGYLRVWNVTTGREKFHRYFPIHTSAGRIWNKHIAVCFSPDGKQIVVSYHRLVNQRGLTVLDAETGEMIDEVMFRPNGVRIVTLAFDPDGSRLAAGSLDGTVFVLDARTRAELLSFKSALQVIHLQFSPNGELLALGKRQEDPKKGSDVYLHDSRNGQLKMELTGLTYNVPAVAFSPDGSSLAAGNNPDGRIKVWNVQSGQIVHSITGGGAIESLVFNEDGSRLFVAYETPLQSVHVCDLKSGTKSYNLLKPVSSANRPEVYCLRTSADGKRLITGGHDGTVRVWDANSGEPIGATRELPEPWTQVEVTSDRQRIVLTSRDGLVHVFNTTTWQVERTLSEPGLSAISEIELSRDGKLLAAIGKGKTVVWNATTGKRLWSAQIGAQEGRVAFSHDGLWLGVINRSHAIMLFEAATGQLKKEYVDFVATDLAFSADNERLVVGNDVDKDKGSIRVIKTWTGEEVFSRTFDSDLLGPVSFSPDGDEVIIVTSNVLFLAEGNSSISSATFVLDAETGEQKSTLNQTGIVAMRSDLRQFLATRTNATANPPRIMLSVGDTATMNNLHLIGFPGRKVLDAALTADGKHAIVVNEGGTTYVLNLTETTTD